MRSGPASPAHTPPPGSGTGVADGAEARGWLWWPQAGAVVVLGRRVPSRALAVGLSLLAHALLALLMLLIVLAPPGGGLGASDDIGFAVLAESTLSDLPDDPSGASGDLQSLPEAAAAAQALPDAPTLEGLEQSQTPVSLGGAGSVGSGLGAGGGEGEGLAGGGLGGGGGGASFFGVEAVGSRFAYIVDVSGSMTGGRLEVLKEQLSASVRSLAPHGAFAVYTFSTQGMSRRLGPDDAWTPATDANKRAVATEIRALVAQGGTEPLEAFELVFTLSPRPDAVYFMTDGEFQEENMVIGRIAGMNGQGRRRVPVHCIAFGSEVSEDAMQRIARQSGGTYAFVPEPGSGRGP